MHLHRAFGFQDPSELDPRDQDVEAGEIPEITDDDGTVVLIASAPIEEPVAWHGPIMMNTQKNYKPLCAICAMARSSNRRTNA